MPTTLAPARVLTPDEVAAYHRDGFLIVRGLYSGQQMLDWKAVMKTCLTGPFMQIGICVWMSDAIHPTLRDAMADNHIVPILRQLIGDPLAFLSAKAVFKDTGTRFGTPWHQDWYYWFGSPKTSVWIALDDATPDNGCLKLVPGSHKMSFRNIKDEGEGLVNRIDEKQIQGLPIVDGKVNRGDVVFFTDRTVHASHPNTAGADRWSLISTYRRADVPDDSTAWKTAMPV